MSGSLHSLINKFFFLFSFVFCIFFSSHLFSQTTFMKAYGSSQTDEGRTVHQTSDSGYIISGVSNGVLFSAGGYDMYLIKTNSLGAVQWSRTYGGLHDEHIAGHLPDMQITRDGGYIIAGQTKTFSNPFSTSGFSSSYIVKTSSAGNVQWSM